MCPPWLLPPYNTFFDAEAVRWTQELCGASLAMFNTLCSVQGVPVELSP